MTSSFVKKGLFLNDEQLTTSALPPAKRCCVRNPKKTQEQVLAVRVAATLSQSLKIKKHVKENNEHYITVMT